MAGSRERLMAPAARSRGEHAKLPAMMYDRALHSNAGAARAARAAFSGDYQFQLLFPRQLQTLFLLFPPTPFRQEQNNFIFSGLRVGCAAGRWDTSESNRPQRREIRAPPHYTPGR